MSFIIPPIEHLGPGHSLRFNRKSGSLALTPKSTLYKNPKQSFGSRVRRDTVRSAPGRAELVRTGPTGDDLSNPLTLANVPDGRFPCPHCNKTYLRAKHFKRHLLRHNGDRRYVCALCTRTFSRSDVLKRHFQKCSLHRGNPIGARYLPHAQLNFEKSFFLHPSADDYFHSMDREYEIVDGQTNGLGVTLADESPHLTNPLSCLPDLERKTGGGSREPRNLTGPVSPGSGQSTIDYSPQIDLLSNPAQTNGVSSIPQTASLQTLNLNYDMEITNDGAAETNLSPYSQEVRLELDSLNWAEFSQQTQTGLSGQIYGSSFEKGSLGFKFETSPIETGRKK